MRAKELMIGDFVHVGNRTIPCDTIVCEIFNDDFCVVPTIDGNEKIKCADLFPIPLTPEILEKNGWVSKRDGSGDFIYMRESTPGYGSNDLTVTMNVIGNFQMIHGSFNGISVPYVHELQHALRLCGIEKEIEL